MRKVMIIGAGGIGSFLASFLDRITSDMDAEIPIREECYRMVEYVSKNLIDRNEHFTNAYLSSTIWLTGQMLGYRTLKQDIVAKACEVHTFTVRWSSSKIYEMFQLDKKSLMCLGVENFVAGVRLDG